MFPRTSPERDFGPEDEPFLIELGQAIRGEEVRTGWHWTITPNRKKRRNNSSNTPDDPIYSLIVTAKPIVRGSAGVPIRAYAIF
jgi:hypothetical protein